MSQVWELENEEKYNIKITKEMKAEREKIQEAE